MVQDNTYQHPDITKALLSGGCYWDEIDELNWEHTYSKTVNRHCEEQSDEAIQWL